MHDGMFDPADILVNRHPVIHPLTVERSIQKIRAAVTKEIPGRLNKGVHGIGLAPRRLTTQRAGYVDKGVNLGQRAPPLAGKFHIHGKANRQILIRYRYYSACLTVNDGDWVTPIALTRDAPVAQSEIDGLLTDPFLFQKIGNGLLG